MTNQDVINFLNQVRKMLLDDKSWLESTIQPINEAFDKSISAIQAQESKHSNESSITQKALDTISRQAAIDALIGITTFKTKHELMQRVNASVQDEQGWLGAVAECLDEIEDLPSAQPDLDEVYAHAETEAEARFHAQIVRCEDCKHRTSYWGNCRLLEEKYHQSVLVDGDSFCSMAERITE